MAELDREKVFDSDACGSGFLWCMECCRVYREGVAVRTLLKYEDLLLMRKIFVWYASYNRSNNDAVRARELMKRMLRKGGSEFYAKKR